MNITETPLLAELTREATISPETPTESERFKISWAREVYKATEPLAFLVEGLVTRGSVNLLVGEGGAKKTWALLDLAVCVATGMNWLDFILHQAPVLIVDEESGDHRLRRRLYETLNGHLVKESDAVPIAFTSLNAFDLRNNADVCTLKGMIEETRAGLVIIDALADVMPGADENSVKDVQPLFLKLREVAEKTNAAIFLIHHSNKQNGYRGSTAIKGAVDLMLMVESQPESKYINFNAEKARDIEPRTFTALATWQEEKAQFYLSATETKGKVSVNKSQAYVLRYLLEHGNSSIDDIADNADTCKPDAARRTVYNMAHDKLIERTNTGTGRGHVAEYDLTDKGRELAKVQA